MHAGIDFGTSNCLISTAQSGAARPLPLTGDTDEMPSAIYVLKAAIAAQSIDDPRHQETLSRRIASAKTQQTAEVNRAKEKYERALSASRRHGNQQRMPASWKEYMSTRVMMDSEIEGQQRTVLQRELNATAEEGFTQQGIAFALSGGGETTFGQEAISQNLLAGSDGFFIKSPKSFLGASLHQRQLDVFQEVSSRMLAHIKANGEQQVDEPIDSVVIGRPVNFHGTRGEEGNRQAIEILQAAARKAGYKHVEFMLEPVAAAIDFERTLTEDNTVLVVDLGGGTTDCTVLRLGPSHRNKDHIERDVLAHTGSRIGGIDLDIQLAFHEFMPHFGKGTSRRDGLPIPQHIFLEACSVNDLPAQRRFGKEDLDFLCSRADEPEKLSRLLSLQRNAAMPRLSLTAEEAKIALSDAEIHSASLDYLEPRFVIEARREIFEAAIEQQLSKFAGLAHEAVRQAQVTPSLVYVTGGTAKSPVIRRALRQALGSVEIVAGNLFNGVVSGLATHSESVYR